MNCLCASLYAIYVDLIQANDVREELWYMVGNRMIGCFFYKERITVVVIYMYIQEASS